MIKKIENCLYCGEKMESKTAKKKFCCPLHRVYWNREKSAVKKLGDAFSSGSLTPPKEINLHGNKVTAEVVDKKAIPEPKEGTMAFWNKYGCMTWDGVEKTSY